MKLKTCRVIWVIAMLAGCASNQPSNQHSAAASQARLQLGLEYLRQGEMQAASYNLQKALERTPQDYRAHLAMALFYQKVANNESARSHYQRALRLAPDNPTVLNNYGAFLCSLGQYVAAQRQFSSAARLGDNGQVADSLENAGYCSLLAGQMQSAQTLLMRALKISPEKGETILAEAEKQFGEGKHVESQLLLDSYQNALPASADSLWLQIRFAASAGRQDSVQHYGKQLARSFPQSKQYQQFLANEY
ncbi:type IV pilus biogenesis/stability protein PilW [Serratia microhaemolytica]|uniref:type IV pilus biogenesis/stability protein PilW n=1 Tax=Serratia microhaemolytica TaxID=2675110 RepID=UPI000FDED242|nr:type IV pilus biogenesis/stability protein PilW [Serratia microhaemolytica]